MYHNHFDNAAKTYTILDGYWFSLDILHTDNWYHYEPKTNLLEKKKPTHVLMYSQIHQNQLSVYIRMHLAKFQHKDNFNINTTAQLFLI